MTGIVDEVGQALLHVRVKSGVDASETPLEVWIDTGFTGDLVVPQAQINALGLQVGSAIKATLADGSMVQLDAYECLVEWFGTWKRIEVIANQGRFPLLGVGLLKNRELNIDYKAKSLNLT
jgi:clan AA aspartic protease